MIGIKSRVNKDYNKKSNWFKNNWYQIQSQ